MTGLRHHPCDDGAVGGAPTQSPWHQPQWGRIFEEHCFCVSKYNCRSHFSKSENTFSQSTVTYLANFAFRKIDCN